MGVAWVCGTLNGHRFQALVFPQKAQRAEWEYKGRRISKLWIQHCSDKRRLQLGPRPGRARRRAGSCHQRMICEPGPEAREYVLRVDRSGKPATYRIDGVAGGRVEGRRFWGVLRVEKDVLTLTYSSTNAPMPTGFDGDRQGEFVEVYRLVKR
jgi:hypothetical protein